MNMPEACNGCEEVQKRFPPVQGWQDRAAQTYGSPVAQMAWNGHGASGPPRTVILDDGRSLGERQISSAWYAARSAQRERTANIQAFTENCPGRVEAQPVVDEMPVTVKVCGAIVLQAAANSAAPL